MTKSKPQPPKKKPTRSASARSHADEALAFGVVAGEVSFERHIFYQKISIVLAAVLAVSVLANIFLGLRGTEIRYFATDGQGNVRELLALDQPVKSQTEVLNFATKAITNAFSLRFDIIDRQLNGVSSFFTSTGWDGFKQAISETGYLDLIRNNQFVSTAVPRQAPVIVAEGLVHGRYAWKVQVPLTVTFESTSRETKEYLVTATVVQQPYTDENPTGLGILQVIAR